MESLSTKAFPILTIGTNVGLSMSTILSSGLTRMLFFTCADAITDKDVSNDNMYKRI